MIIESNNPLLKQEDTRPNPLPMTPCADYHSNALAAHSAGPLSSLLRTWTLHPEQPRESLTVPPGTFIKADAHDELDNRVEIQERKECGHEHENDEENVHGIMTKATSNSKVPLHELILHFPDLPYFAMHPMFITFLSIWIRFRQGLSLAWHPQQRQVVIGCLENQILVLQQYIDSCMYAAAFYPHVVDEVDGQSNYMQAAFGTLKRRIEIVHGILLTLEYNRLMRGIGSAVTVYKITHAFRRMVIETFPWLPSCYDAVQQAACLTPLPTTFTFSNAIPHHLSDSTFMPPLDANGVTPMDYETTPLIAAPPATPVDSSMTFMEALEQPLLYHSEDPAVCWCQPQNMNNAQLASQRMHESFQQEWTPPHTAISTPQLYMMPTTDVNGSLTYFDQQQQQQEEEQQQSQSHAIKGCQSVPAIPMALPESNYRRLVPPLYYLCPASPRQALDSQQHRYTGGANMYIEEGMQDDEEQENMEEELSSVGEDDDDDEYEYNENDDEEDEYYVSKRSRHRQRPVQTTDNKLTRSKHRSSALTTLHTSSFPMSCSSSMVRPNRSRRTATSYDAETTHYLKSIFYKSYSVRDKLTKEERQEIQEKTGLKPRNITYWFSNHKRRFQPSLNEFKRLHRETHGRVATFDDFVRWRRLRGLTDEVMESVEESEEDQKDSSTRDSPSSSQDSTKSPASHLATPPQ